MYCHLFLQNPYYFHSQSFLIVKKLRTYLWNYIYMYLLIWEIIKFYVYLRVYRVDFSTDKKLCKSRYNTLEVQCVGWWSRQNCFNFWIYVAIWAWNWICKGSAAWLKKHWVHTSTAMLLLWAAKKTSCDGCYILQKLHIQPKENFDLLSNLL